MNFKYSIETDGVTQGLLATWLACRQKAKWYLSGLSLRSSNMSMTYGEIGHAVLESIYNDIRSKKLWSSPDARKVRSYIGAIEKEWHKEHPRADKKSLEYVELACLIAEATLPLYFDYWKKDIKEIKWQQLEHEFAIPYITKDKRKTVIRGKMDGVFSSPKLWLFESKFKSRINEGDMVDTLPFELQVMLYIWALIRSPKFKDITPSGVLYNVIRRLGLEQKKDETITQFAQRCIQDIQKRPEYYFIRLEISIGRDDLNKFEGELEDMLTDFMDWWAGKTGHYKNTGHCIDKYGRCPYLLLCAGYKNSTAYIKRDRIFRELEDY